MFKSALLALDLSRAEAPLLGCMPALVSWGVERVVIVHVIRVGYAQGPQWRQDEQAAAHIETAAAPLRAAGLTVDVQVRAAGVPAEEILSAAREAGADLLVVGSRSHDLVHRLFLGSVARDLIHKARLPVLLQWVEPTAEGTAARCHAVCPETLRSVLLTTDHSRQAQAAERTAVALAGKAQRLDALTVLTPAAVDATPALPQMTRAALQTRLDELADPARRGQALVEVDAAPPAEVIARCAARLEVSLIVMGRHGQGTVGGALVHTLIGSTASALCATAGRPVLVVPMKNAL